MNNFKLPKDKSEIIDGLVEKVKRDYQEDIDAVICYGSYVTQTYNELSDLDFFFIPKTKKANEMSLQFIINEIGYDFWPITWERLEGFIKLKEDFVSLIGKGELVYYRNDDVLSKFYDMKMRSQKLLDADLKTAIRKHLYKSKALYFDMYQENSDYVSEILDHLITAVAYINKQYIIKSPSHLKEEIKYYEVLPVDFEERIEKIISHSYMVISTEIEKLILDVEKLSKKQFDKHHIVELNGFYEELKSTYNKVYHGCEEKDLMKVYFALSQVCKATKDVLKENYNAYPFPDLTKEVRSKRFDSIKNMTKIHEETFCFILKEHNEIVNTFSSNDQFIAYLRDL
ncbi:MAG: nucleotidyltransferase domain-containing protein [Clostridiales bacterium]|nr:nucleotidyltransferase domain-containing protein [Clostridiales bacterium]